MSGHSRESANRTLSPNQNPSLRPEVALDLGSSPASFLKRHNLVLPSIGLKVVKPSASSAKSNFPANKHKNKGLPVIRFISEVGG